MLFESIISFSLSFISNASFVYPLKLFRSFLIDPPISSPISTAKDRDGGLGRGSSKPSRIELRRASRKQPSAAPQPVSSEGLSQSSSQQLQLQSPPLRQSSPPLQGSSSQPQPELQPQSHPPQRQPPSLSESLVLPIVQHENPPATTPNHPIAVRFDPPGFDEPPLPTSYVPAQPNDEHRRDEYSISIESFSQKSIPVQSRRHSPSSRPAKRMQSQILQTPIRRPPYRSIDISEPESEPISESESESERGYESESEHSGEEDLRRRRHRPQPDRRKVRSRAGTRAHAITHASSSAPAPPADAAPVPASVAAPFSGVLSGIMVIIKKKNQYFLIVLFSKRNQI